MRSQIMDNEIELSIENAERIKFKVTSPIYGIETLKHMRAGAKGDAKAVEGSKTLLRVGAQYLFGRRALKRAEDAGYIIVTDLK